VVALLLMAGIAVRFLLLVNLHGAILRQDAG
jgi:hypothetical protein